MHMLRQLGLLSLTLGLAVAACDDDEPSGPAPEVYTTTLNGANESPPYDDRDRDGDVHGDRQHSPTSSRSELAGGPNGVPRTFISLPFPRDDGGVLLGCPTASPA